ncbi:hypothetical protein BDK51DRAFT_24074, partial [Blyttiomyces helicus]
IDIIDGFDQDLVVRLVALAPKHDFVIIQDRQFADIGACAELILVRGEEGGNKYHLPLPSLPPSTVKIEYPRETLRIATACTDFIFDFIGQR